MKLFCSALTILIAVPLWSQTDGTFVPPAPAVSLSPPENGTDANSNSDLMMTPPPVSGQAFPTVVGSAERSNYLRGGVAFTSAYTDNAIGSVNGHPVSDVSNSIVPTVALDETTSRLRTTLSYSSGFTLYERESQLDQANQNASISVQYRLSPHVTLSGRDSLLKTSNVFNQPDLSSASAISGNIGQPNFSVIAPTASILTNSGNVGISYQFAMNAMVGASGIFSTIHYPNPAQVPGLYDSSSQGGSLFYCLRVFQTSYMGATYQYQRMVAAPTGGVTETQTHGVMLFYSLQLASRFSLSVFGGPQYSDTLEPRLSSVQTAATTLKSWSPVAGGSFAWQGKLTQAAFSYSHIISGGSGLIGAVHLDSASVSFGRQVQKTTSASVSGTYADNNVLAIAMLGGSRGHTISFAAVVQKQFGQRIGLQLGYTRLHQDYNDVAVISSTADTNRESVSISYQFSRPLGR